MPTIPQSCALPCLIRAQRQFGVKRMCYRASIDDWLDLGQTGPVAELASALIPTLGTDQFYELR